MLAKCANPICGAHFLYLKQGRIYNVPVYQSPNLESSATATVTSGAEHQSCLWPKRVEHFWLCAICCTTLTLVLRNGIAEVQARFPQLTDGGARAVPQPTPSLQSNSTAA